MEKTKRAGFTLVEALVAIAILKKAIAGAMYAANRAIVAAEIAQEQLTASYLAQEGIEYVRSMRDGAYLNAIKSSDPNATTDSWNDFLNGNNPWSIKQCNKNNVSKSCTLDPFQKMGTGPGDSLNPCNVPPDGNSCTPLYLTPSNIYTQNSTGNAEQPYTRTIRMESVSGAPVDVNNNPVDIRTRSLVTWTFNGSSYSVTVTDHLTPWQ
ncbi:MAG: type IV pilus modification PilV family protein [Minisyncoccota bacterium]